MPKKEILICPVTNRPCEMPADCLAAECCLLMAEGCDELDPGRPLTEDEKQDEELRKLEEKRRQDKDKDKPPSGPPPPRRPNKDSKKF